MRVAAVMIALAVTGCGSCKDNKPAAKTDPRAATIPGAGSARLGGIQRKPNWTAPGSGSSAGHAAPTAVVTKLSAAEATPIIPTIQDTTLIEPPTEAPQGAQVHFAWCTTAVDQHAAREMIENGLADAGWTDFHDRGQGTRIALSADKAPYRISASLSMSPRPNCTPAESQWFSSVQIYKLEAVAHPPISPAP